MATAPPREIPWRPEHAERPRLRADASPLRRLLMPLASLKLTIVLFSLAIFLVLAGTVAQVDKDIWQVVHQYFRTWIATIDFGAFMPRTWAVPGSPHYVGNRVIQWLASHAFYYPGGWTLGSLMAINLIAAHALRFKIQSSGQRLLLGLLAIAAAAALTCLVILSGNNVGAAGEGAWLTWPTLWFFIKIGLAIAVGAGIIGLTSLNSALRAEWWALLAATLLGAGVLTLLLCVGDLGNDASVMRILWQLMKGFAAGAALLGACWIVFKKRAGIVVIHLGVGLMMFNELYVGLSAIESQLHFREGESRNYTEDIRGVELALIDRSDSREDATVVIPKRILTDDKPIRDDRLAFDMRVSGFTDNAELRDVKPSDKNSATAGLGLLKALAPEASNSGASADSAVDTPGAYVTIYPKGTDKPLGTYLISLRLPEQSIEADGKKYDLALRFKRVPKPYAVKLIKFRKDDYMGTSIARNYSSDVRIVDRKLGVDRNVHIKMNEPLRFAGDTFYQSGFDPNDPQSTTLSVVSNDVWMIPYVGCMIVVVGLLGHFLLTLTRFIRRQIGQRETFDKDEPAEAILLSGGRQNELPHDQSAWTLVGKHFPWVAAVLLVVCCLINAIPPSTPTDAPNYYEFGKLPVMFEGRIKPIDTLARIALRKVSDRQDFTDLDKHTRSAVQWLLDTTTNPGLANSYRVFRIENPEVLSLLGLERREGLRYAAEELAPLKSPDDPIAQEFVKQLDLANELDHNKGELSAFQRQVLELGERMTTYRSLQDAFSPLDIASLKLPANIDEQVKQRLVAVLAKRYQHLMEEHVPLAIPAEAKGEQRDDNWLPYATAVDLNDYEISFGHHEPNRATTSLKAVFEAYTNHDTPGFNAAVAEYRARIDAAPPAPVSPGKVAFEAFFNHFEPFYCGIFMYVTAFALACIGFMMWSFGRGEVLNRTAFWLIFATFMLHTLALISRIYISGRPPVTNLYSAAVFVGWGGVLLGMILERIFPLGVGNVIAGAAGFASLLIAHLLASSGDTFTVLVAVLDTQFWLATHVVCVTLGYATTFVAGLLGIVYIVLGVFTPVLEEKATRDWTVGKALATMIYGVVCFALLFSFFGTVLGGLWADDSWGRFWGWDPKENGALIIVIWNALVLHARWDGMVKDRGLAVLATVGNIAVGWSMFGVNQLSAGLHNYGFTDGVALALAIVVAIHLALVALGSLPKRLWLSNRLSA